MKCMGKRKTYDETLWTCTVSIFNQAPAACVIKASDKGRRAVYVIYSLLSSDLQVSARGSQ